MERTIVDVTRKVQLRGTGYGDIVFAIANMIEELTPLHLVSVEKNTSAEYKASFMAENFPHLIILHNSGHWFYMSLATTAGVIVNNGSSIQLGSFGEISEETGSYVYYSRIRVVFSSIGGIINGLQITPGASHISSILYSWANSEATGERLGFWSYAGLSSTSTAYTSIYFPSFTSTDYSIYNGGMVSGIGKSQYPQLTLSEEAFGTNYIWVPIHTIGAISTSVWFGRLLWGGRYTLYRLNQSNLSSPIDVDPKLDYVIDGQIYKACFGYMYDFRED